MFREKGISLIFSFLVLTSLTLEVHAQVSIENLLARISPVEELVRIDTSILSSSVLNYLYSQFKDNSQFRYEKPNGECHKRMLDLNSYLLRKHQIRSGHLLIQCHDSDIRVENRLDKTEIHYMRHFASVVIVEGRDGKLKPVVLDPQFISAPLELEDFLEEVLPYGNPLVFGGEISQDLADEELRLWQKTRLKPCTVLVY